MKIEHLITVVFIVYAVIQFLLRTLKNRGAFRFDEAPPEEPFLEPRIEPAPPAPPRPVAPPPPSPARALAPAPRAPAAPARPLPSVVPPRAPTAHVARRPLPAMVRALRDPASLRHAMILMAVLGPPRSLKPAGDD